MKRVLVICATIGAVMLSSCKSKTEDPVPQKQITINPASVNLSAGGSQQFTLTGNAAAEPVTWSINPSTGTITQGGLYTAPSSLSSNTTVTVTAMLTGDNTVRSTATVNITVAPISFANEILPILGSYCTGCHNGPFPSGSYRTNTYANFMAGGRIVAGEPHNSLVYQRITSTSNPMPPNPQPAPSAAEIEKIRLWIQQGALNN